MSEQYIARYYAWNDDHAFKKWNHPEGVVSVEELESFLGAEVVLENTSANLRLQSKSLVLPENSTLTINKNGYLIACKHTDNEKTTAMNSCVIEEANHSLITEINFGWPIDRSFQLEDENGEYEQWAYNLATKDQNTPKNPPLNNILQYAGKQFIANPKNNYPSLVSAHENDTYIMTTNTFTAFCQDKDKPLTFFSWPNWHYNIYKELNQTSGAPYFMPKSEPVAWGGAKQVLGVDYWGTNYSVPLVFITSGTADSAEIKDEVFKYNDQDYPIPRFGQVIRIKRVPAKDLIIPPQLTRYLLHPETLVNGWFHDVELKSGENYRLYVEDSSDAPIWGKIPLIASSYNVFTSTIQGIDILAEAHTEYSQTTIKSTSWILYDSDQYAKETFVYPFCGWWSQGQDDGASIYNAFNAFDEEARKRIESKFDADTIAKSCRYTAELYFNQLEIGDIQGTTLATIGVNRTLFPVQNYEYSTNLPTDAPSEADSSYSLQKVTPYVIHYTATLDPRTWFTEKQAEYSVALAFYNYLLFPDESLSNIWQIKTSSEDKIVVDQRFTQGDDKYNGHFDSSIVSWHGELYWKEHLINKDTSEFLYPTQAHSDSTNPWISDIKIGDQTMPRFRLFANYGAWDLLLTRITPLSCNLMFENYEVQESVSDDTNRIAYIFNNPSEHWLLRCPPQMGATTPSCLRYMPATLDNKSNEYFLDAETYNRDEKIYMTLERLKGLRPYLRGVYNGNLTATSFYVTPSLKEDFNSTITYGWYWTDNSLHIEYPTAEGVNFVISNYCTIPTIVEAHHGDGTTSTLNIPPLSRQSFYTDDEYEQTTLSIKHNNWEKKLEIVNQCIIPWHKIITETGRIIDLPLFTTNEGDN